MGEIDNNELLIYVKRMSLKNLEKVPDRDAKTCMDISVHVDGHAHSFTSESIVGTVVESQIDYWFADVYTIPNVTPASVFNDARLTLRQGDIVFARAIVPCNVDFIGETRDFDIVDPTDTLEAIIGSGVFGIRSPIATKTEGSKEDSITEAPQESLPLEAVVGEVSTDTAEPNHAEEDNALETEEKPATPPRALLRSNGSAQGDLKAEVTPAQEADAVVTAPTPGRTPRDPSRFSSPGRQIDDSDVYSGAPYERLAVDASFTAALLSEKMFSASHVVLKAQKKNIPTPGHCVVVFITPKSVDRGVPAAALEAAAHSKSTLVLVDVSAWKDVPAGPSTWTAGAIKTVKQECAALYTSSEVPTVLILAPNAELEKSFERAPGRLALRATENSSSPAFLQTTLRGLTRASGTDRFKRSVLVAAEEDVSLVQTFLEVSKLQDFQTSVILVGQDGQEAGKSQGANGSPQMLRMPLSMIGEFNGWVKYAISGF